MLLSKNLIGIFMTLFWISCSNSFVSIFVCTCFFVDKYLRDIVYLKKLIHMRDDTSTIDIFFICWMLIGHAKKYHSLKTMVMLFAHTCISLIICLVMPLTYHFGWAFYYGASYLLLNFFTVASVKLNFLSMIYCKCLCFKW